MKNRKNKNTVQKLIFLFNMALVYRNLDIHKNLIKRMFLVAKKFLIKIPPSIKRSVCGKCFKLRITNGSSKIVDIRNEKYLECQCKCGNIKRYKLNKNNKRCKLNKNSNVTKQINDISLNVSNN